MNNDNRLRRHPNLVRTAKESARIARRQELEKMSQTDLVALLSKHRAPLADEPWSKTAVIRGILSAEGMGI